ncbi:calcineurin-like phosphoesterase family protein [Winogradskyella pacifica]|uniref:Calcineurin-like phosphoesterase family protein n=1 Tax=Winogradskyella pacifica TaxID=664642 RepID=A0A3D9MX73_9FLAO|nr:metallophosphoesterase [Winogradskyella pacifica]REE24713.1 calcineurin-like phosphoesterase family protein [Winogradskyella pacifica]
MLDVSVNIIWLSDIHFNSAYLNDSAYKNLNNYIVSFHEYIDTLKNKGNYDYILISGDIAQGGDVKEYSLFLERIFNELETAFPKASLLIVPGNHDVNRLSTEDLKSNFIDNMGGDERPVFLSKNKDVFYNIFKDYSNAFSGKKVPSKNSSLKDNKLLFGHVLNKEKKTLIILLNSAWYSIGSGFLEHYLNERVFKVNDADEKDEILKDLKEEFGKTKINVVDFKSYLTGLIENKTYLKNVKTIESFVVKLIKEQNIIENTCVASIESLVNRIITFKKKYIVKDIESITNEYGNQLIGLDVFEEEFLEIQKLYKTYNDFVVTTIMHHPINWLDFDERVPYKNKEDKVSKFHDIKNFTDLLLTGHEHVPTEHKTEMINNNELLHIQAGCFMNFRSDPSKFKVNNNWFSTLSININKRTVTQLKHYCDANGAWSAAPADLLKLKKKHNTKLSIERKIDIELQVINCCKLINYKNHKKVINLDSGYYKYKKSLYMVIDDFQNNNFQNNDFGICFDKLKEKIEEVGLNKVYFLAKDSAHPLFDNYINESKMVVIEKIKIDFDFKFDNFRNNFFSSLCQDEAEKYIKLKFIGIVKPYWVTETC